jgi:hypothetical protein
MPYWGWILFIVGLSILAFAIFFFSIHVMHRQVPARQVAQGDPSDISAPLAKDITKEQDSIDSGDAMTAREIERERAGSSRARDRAQPTRSLFPPGRAGPPSASTGYHWQSSETSFFTGAASGGSTRSSHRSPEERGAGCSSV